MGLRASLDRERPSYHGERDDAITTWFVRWNYSFDTGPSGGCSVVSVGADVDVVGTFPRWLDPSRGSRELRARWADYTWALATHETGHESIGVGAANSVVRALTRLGDAPSCVRAEDAANAEAGRVLDVWRAREIEYDDSTDHGATQGARFP